MAPSASACGLKRSVAVAVSLVWSAHLGGALLPPYEAMHGRICRPRSCGQCRVTIVRDLVAVGGAFCLEKPKFMSSGPAQLQARNGRGRGGT